MLPIAPHIAALGARAVAAAAAAQAVVVSRAGGISGTRAAAVPFSSAAGRRLAYKAGPLLEVREYTLQPWGMRDYLRLSADHAELRSRLMPFLGMFTCDTGGELNRVTHFYAYAGMAQRDEARRTAAADKEWAAYVDAGRKYMVKQESRIFIESAGVYAATGAAGAAAFEAPGDGGPGLYEWRQYQLHPGYGSVPKLLRAFEEGLPHKVRSDPEGRLVAFASSDVGTLNQVVELWRYPSAAACILARQAARRVPEWRDTISAVTPGVQHFSTSFLLPCSFSPWQ